MELTTVSKQVNETVSTEIEGQKISFNYSYDDAKEDKTPYSVEFSSTNEKGEYINGSYRLQDNYFSFNSTAINPKNFKMIEEIYNMIMQIIRAFTAEAERK